MNDTGAARPWGRLKRRPEFQRAGKGRRVTAAAFTLQAAARTDDADGPRFGLTVTKKTGDSPARNRIRRRLREAMRRISPLDAQPNHDYVLLARREALSTPFDTLVEAIAGAIHRVSAERRGRPARDERT